MTLRNVDECSELLEIRGAHFYIGILSVNRDERQRGVNWGSVAVRLGLWVPGSGSNRFRKRAELERAGGNFGAFFDRDRGARAGRLGGGLAGE